jgi:thiol-disulfide isomerase/thioredoxin
VLPSKCNEGGNDVKSRTLRHAILILAAAILAQPTTTRAQDAPRAGLWHAWLDSPGGELPFGLELKKTDSGDYEASVHNGSENMMLTGASSSAGNLTIRIDHYDSTITAKISDNGKRLDGIWKKQSKGSEISQLPFHAVFGPTQRFTKSSRKNAPDKTVSGRWAVKFDSDKYKAVGSFEQQPDGTVTGTFMTATGDYRYLAGDFDGKRLRLSTFDGAHAFLFTATLGADDTLSGDFWSRDTWHEKWTGQRDSNASLRNPFMMNRYVTHVKMGDLHFRDLDGEMRILSEPEFQNKLIILEIFGSWCPNCHDAADFMVELDNRYRDVGLSIIGLAFELTGDFQRDAKQVKRFKKRHNIDYPTLIAGTADKGEAKKTLPFLDRLISYPTIVIIDSKYRIKAVYTGFSGPATGPAYESLKEKIHDIIGDALLRPKTLWEK